MDVAVASGVPVWCGGMLETRIGLARNMALAALPGFVLPADLPASARYYLQDLTPSFELEGGCLQAPTGPGIGVDIIGWALTRCTSASRELYPGGGGQ